ncbi:MULTISPECIES: aminodeoxychorismate lyase [unclassified Vibrio]|uniref:Aminodeoxychorismate lyase n=1 Tax=Vibrio sp. HB236076 TaxID=3232307 RepID=A0AB39HCF5_9VIBR|nr:aminodeoxychorismate lyase [Vibrio sp. HB161653]MDP5253693.1 aminodeoxychorismate lyase [Vibrio sp. HB161653]
MFWRNGELIEHIDVRDRSFQYGDGCFTTLLVKERVIQHWPLHQQRLQLACQRLGIDMPNWSQLYSGVQSVIPDLPRVGVKIHLSRGMGGRGYQCQGVEGPSVVISTFDYPLHYQQWQREGIALALSDVKLGLNPLLAGIKHNNRLEQILAKQSLHDDNGCDAVMLNINDHVIETTIANLFWFKNNVLYTPKLDLSGVCGVMRKVVIETAERLGIECRQGDYFVSDLLSAQEVFTTNCLMEVVPVNQFLGQGYVSKTITQRLQEEILS